MTSGRLAVGLVLTWAGVITAVAADPPAAPAPPAPAVPAITLPAAVEAALKEVAGAKLIEVDLEKAGQTSVWEMDLLVGDALKKAQVDVTTGKVLKVWDATAEEPGEAAAAKKVVAAAKVTWQAALETAQQNVKDGRPVHIELEFEGGQALYTVELLSGGKRVELEVDAVTGKPPQPAGGAKAGKEEDEDEDEGEGEEEGDDEGDHEGKDEGEHEGQHGQAHDRAAGRHAEVPFTEDFGAEHRTFASTGRNPFFILEPGYQLILEGKEGKRQVRVVITVLNETRKVGNVETRVVEERETKDGELAEVSRNYFAICKQSKDVFYFGETTDDYKGGQVSGHEGAWEAGANGARPGLIMPGTPLLGSRFYQEIAPKVAMDRAEIVSLSETLKTPAGEYQGCMKVEETTPLEPGEREYKLYAPGVGLIQDGGLVLIEVKKQAGKE